MAYMPHIQNLYKNQDILLFKECYCLEKVHGTNTKIVWRHSDSSVTFYSGGEKHATFIMLFNKENLIEVFKSLGLPSDRDTTIFGEGYAGSQQGMSNTYGKQSKFIGFDVQVGNTWLDVPNAELIITKLGLEFVPYVKCPTNLVDLDRERDADSIIAIRNGCGPGKKREGIIIRPLIELTRNNGERIIAKHKRDDFSETKTPRIVDLNQLKILTDAKQIADEWVTPMRLSHVLDKMPSDIGMEKTRDVIYAMVEDVMRESAGEIVPSDAVSKAIGQKTVQLFKEHLKAKLVGVTHA